MRKWIFLLSLLLLLCGCSRTEETRQLICVGGELYYSTGQAMPVEMDPSSYLGVITSSVEPGQIPTEEGQTNFGNLGEIYARLGEKGLAVIIEQERVRFLKE